MKHFSTLLFLFVLCVPIFATSRSVTMPGDSGVLLVRGTQVKLRFMNTLSSRDLSEGSVVNLQAVQNVVAGNEKVVILENALATARVKRVTKRGVFGKGALIELEPLSVTTVDGRQMPLESDTRWLFRGDQRQGLAWGLSMGGPVIGLILLTPWLLPLAAVGLLIKGKDVKIAPTTQLIAGAAKNMRIVK